MDRRSFLQAMLTPALLPLVKKQEPPPLPAYTDSLNNPPDALAPLHDGKRETGVEYPA